MTFKFKAFSVACAHAIGHFTSKFIAGLITGLQASGWQVSFDPDRFLWSANADPATLEETSKITKGPCDNFEPAPLTKP